MDENTAENDFTRIDVSEISEEDIRDRINHTESDKFVIDGFLDKLSVKLGQIIARFGNTNAVVYHSDGSVEPVNYSKFSFEKGDAITFETEPGVDIAIIEDE